LIRAGLKQNTRREGLLWLCKVPPPGITAGNPLGSS